MKKSRLGKEANETMSVVGLWRNVGFLDPYNQFLQTLHINLALVYSQMIFFGSSRIQFLCLLLNRVIIL